MSNLLINLKWCYKCKKFKKKEEFRNNRSKKDGKCSECKNCNSILERAYYLKNREYILNRHKTYFKTEQGKKAQAKNIKKFRLVNSNRTNLYDKIKRLIKSGKIEKFKYCELCSKTDTLIHGHHYSYAKEFELDLVWLCEQCHIKVHIEKIPREYFRK